MLNKGSVLTNVLQKQWGELYMVARRAPLTRSGSLEPNTSDMSTHFLYSSSGVLPVAEEGPSPVFVI